MTGAGSTISARQLEERYTANILDNLEGRVAGLVTYGDKTMIRGTSSLYVETAPLIGRGTGCLWRVKQRPESL